MVFCHRGKEYLQLSIKIWKSQPLKAPVKNIGEEKLTPEVFRLAIEGDREWNPTKSSL